MGMRSCTSMSPRPRPGPNSSCIELKDLISAKQRENPGLDIRLLTIPTYNETSVEPVPPRGDRSSVLEHYWESIHFRTSLGSEIFRLLHPKGRLALNTICAGSVNPIHFPVIWANNPSISFLRSPNELRQVLGTSGFKELLWRDDTKKVLEEIQTMRSKPPSNKPRPINLALIIKDTSKKWKNIVRNLKEGRIVVIQGIFEHT